MKLPGLHLQMGLMLRDVNLWESHDFDAILILGVTIRPKTILACMNKNWDTIFSLLLKFTACQTIRQCP